MLLHLSLVSFRSPFWKVFPNKLLTIFMCIQKVLLLLSNCLVVAQDTINQGDPLFLKLDDYKTESKWMWVDDQVIDRIIVHCLRWWRARGNARDTSRNGRSTKRNRLASLTCTADATAPRIFSTRKKNVKPFARLLPSFRRRRNRWMRQLRRLPPAARPYHPHQYLLLLIAAISCLYSFFFLILTRYL